MDEVRIKFHGAAGCVTGSCTEVVTQQSRILVDCGHTHERTAKKFDFNPREVNAVIMTHAHLDHCGMAPWLFANGFCGKVYGHGASCETAKIVWQDTLAMSGRTGQSDFTAENVREAVKSLVPVAYTTPFSADGIEAILYDAGHILGSSHVLLNAGSRRILFSGDIGVRRTPIIRDPTFEWEKPVDTVIIESTYGNRLHRDRSGTVREFGEIIRHIRKYGHIALIPAFAIGRTQEILFHFNDLIEHGDIERMPVVVDSPMANSITRIYRAHEECYDGPTRARILSGDMPLEFPGLGQALSVSESRAIHNLRPPFAVIAGSGMCNGGRILNHLKRFLPQESTHVIFCGFQAQGTLGRKLVERAREIEIDNERIPVKAQIHTLGGFSAHADYAGLLEWAGAIPGKPRFLVNHGEPEPAQALAAKLRKELGAEAEAAKPANMND